MMKKTGVLLLLLLVLGGALLPGAAAVYTEEQVNITSGEYYDTEQQYFFFPQSSLNNSNVYATVANGMIVNGTVRVWADLNLTMEVYRDGELVDMGDSDVLTRPGSYRVTVIGNSGVSVSPLSFTIVSADSCNIGAYVLPSGFQLTAIYLNEEELENRNVYQAEFDQEGFYRVEYRCLRTNISYELCVTTDFTAPTLALREVDENLVARSAVDISDVERGCSILIRRDGEIIPYSEELTDTGSYYIRVTDAAGNATEYTFRIRAYLSGASVLFIIMILAVNVGILAILLRERKNFRVR